MTAPTSYPTALPSDWADTFVLPADDHAGYIEAFLEQIGEHAFALGTVLASLDSGHDYYLAFVTPTEFEQLSRPLTAHDNRVSPSVAPQRDEEGSLDLRPRITTSDHLLVT
ncbi:hypothetical protein ACFYV7_30540 [Nocardia suismassiliense]|uniref:Uncharacterized protein n=1 Tax=Nocardia suismassiliense TaxID=2077092 RepID=A0ABW6R0V9_9NOCA